MEQLKETTNINTSLHVLGLCVSALTEPNRKHIPYRNSVLTRLLQDSLGGNGRTVLVATVHQDPAYAEETRSTLQFASRASKIKVRSVMMLIWEGGGRGEKEEWRRERGREGGRGRERKRERERGNEERLSDL